MFDVEFITDRGKREVNEDAYGVAEVNGNSCWVIADGLGGHRGGELAAKETVGLVLESFRSRPEVTSSALEGHLQAAQSGVLTLQKRDPNLSQMQSTVVILVSDGIKAIWAHAGDSRLYHLRSGSILFETADHNVTRRKVAAGLIQADDARSDEDRNRLLQSIGKPSNFDPTVLEAPVSLCRGDAFLLCVDGFWAAVFEAEMEIDLAKSPTSRIWLKKMESRLRERLAPGGDNYTACAVRAVDPKLPAPSKGREATGRWPAPEIVGIGLAGCLALLLVFQLVPARQIVNRSAVVQEISRPVKPHTNAPTYQMARLDSGTFMMGPPSESHEVVLNTVLEFDIFEVTQARWERLIRRNPSRFANCPACPVERVTWWEALEFANRSSSEANLPLCYALGGCQSEPGSGMGCDSVKSAGVRCKGYRLPTEAEWEHAARRGYALNELADTAWFADNSQRRTHAIGAKKASIDGVYDLLGNVSEWVWDSWGTAARKRTVDPTGPDRAELRVYRGGNWTESEFRCSPTWRGKMPPEEYSDKIGFRLVRTVSIDEATPSPVPGSSKDGGAVPAVCTARGQWQKTWEVVFLDESRESKGRLAVTETAIAFTPSSTDGVRTIWPYREIERFMSEGTSSGGRQLLVLESPRGQLHRFRAAGVPIPARVFECVGFTHPSQ